MNINGFPDIQTASSPGTSATDKVAAVSPVQPVQEVKAQTEPSREQLEKAVQRANELVKLNNSDLSFQIDPDLKKPIVKVIDRETQAVLRQIPSVEMLEVAKAIEKMQGALVSTKA